MKLQIRQVREVEEAVLRKCGGGAATVLTAALTTFTCARKEGRRKIAGTLNMSREMEKRSYLCADDGVSRIDYGAH